MAITSVQICNIALTRIGAARISSLSDSSENAIISNLYYDLIYETVLKSYPWECSTYRTSLSQLSSTPLYEYNYAYQLPVSPKCLRVFETYPETDYKIENGKLLCNLDSVYIKYAARISEAELSSHVALVIAARLAIALSNRIAQDIALKNQLWQEYQMLLRQAKDLDGVSSRPDEKGEFDWIEAGWGDYEDEDDSYLV